MVTVWSDLQKKNASMPIVVTEFWMMTNCSDEHLENASFLIQVVPGSGKASIYLYFFSLSS